MIATRNSYDVIIIGAGSIGLPISYYLSDAGLKVLVIDRYPSAGQASNKHAIGGIRATHSDPAKILLGTRSLNAFASWSEKTGDDIEWHQGGYTFLAYRTEDLDFLKNLVQYQQKNNLNINWLEKEQLINIIPTLNQNNLLGGTYSPRDGSASPLLCAFSFNKQAKLAGAQFRFSETVLDLITDHNSIIGVITDKGKYYSQWVVEASGGWAKYLSKKIGITIPVEPDSHEAGITEPMQRLFQPMIVDMRSRPGSANFYFYQHPTGKIIFCLTPDPPIIGTHTIASSEFLPLASRRLLEIMPILKDIRVRRVWRGTYPMAPDGSPILGSIKGLEGYILAVGMCGQGFMFGPGVGQLINNIILCQTSQEDKIILDRLSYHREYKIMEKLK